jgi:hypothetical protein
MIYRLAADAVVVVHLLFAGFVVLGGLLALRWPRVVRVHLPAAVWGALIEFMGWICPLTPLEVRLRRAAGGEGYPGGFVDHYLLPLLYPAQLTGEIQLVTGVFVIAVNVAVYAVVLYRLVRLRR